MKEGTKKDIKEMVIVVLLSFLFFVSLMFFWCEDDPRDEDAMLEEIKNHQNVVAINRWGREHDFRNIFYLDVSLKNDVRIYVYGCKRGENKDIIYKEVYTVNGWRLIKAVYYEDTDEYDSNFADDIIERMMGHSLEYLLDNYQTLYDLYMNAPEIDHDSYNTRKEFFDSIPDEGMFDVYDEETGKVIGVGKLFRVKNWNYEYYQPNYTNE